MSDEGSLLESGRLLERDAVSEGLELALVSSHGALRMTPIEVIRAEFVVRDAVAHHVVRDLENLVAHRHDRLLVPPMPLHAVIARLERGALAVDGSEPRLNQCAAQILVALPRLA